MKKPKTLRNKINSTVNNSTIPRGYWCRTDYETYHNYEDEREEIRRKFLKEYFLTFNIQSIDELIEHFKNADKMYPKGWTYKDDSGLEYRLGIDLSDKLMLIRSEFYNAFFSGKILMDFDYVSQVIRDVFRKLKLESLDLDN